MKTMMTALLLSLAMVAGCGNRDDGASRASSTLAKSGDDVFAVNVDEGTVTRVRKNGDTTTSARLGSEPTRIAAADGKLFVTLRGDGELVIVDAESLEVLQRVAVGSEPYGVVTTADGARAYVAVSLEDKVLEIETAGGKTLREFAIPHEPKWLALNPTESVLFVAAHRAGGEVSAVDLESGRVRTREAPPVGSDHGPEEDDVVISTGSDDGRIPADLTVRNTGDLVVSPDGGTLAVPAVYVDNLTPVTNVDEGGGGGGYGSTGVGVSRVNPALVLYEVSGAGELGEGKPVFLGVAPSRGDFGGPGAVLRSYPNAAGVDPDGRYYVVSMEGSDAVIVVDSEPFPGQREGQPRRKGFTTMDSPSLLGFWDRPTSVVTTDGSGPRGLAFVDGELVIHSFLDRRVEGVPWSDVLAANRHEANDARGEADPVKVGARAKVRELVPSALPADVERGRRLFLSATNPEVSGKGSGISCATCHHDGRDDSLTWTFREGQGEVHLQTPSLAGPVNDTAPLTWRSPVLSVAEEAQLTTTLRMGGTGLSEDDLLAIDAFVTTSRLPDLPKPDEVLVAQGRELFEREDVGCATCHAGDRLTDGEHYSILGGVAANTPGLRGIAATAPYLHDGSLKSLRSVLEWARNGEMGDTSMLSDDELDALEAYLRSL